MSQSFPLQWPSGRPRSMNRRGANYKVSAAKAYDELLSELRLLGATNVVVSSNAPVRRDGRPYSEALTEHHADPGVAVYFVLRVHPSPPETYTVACDQWDRLWQNVRAVGLTIAAMRRIERTGASDLLKRAFQGFAALTDSSTSTRPWWDVLMLPKDAREEDIVMAHRRYSLQRHPDKGGSHEAMSELNNARDQALQAVRERPRNGVAV